MSDKVIYKYNLNLADGHIFLPRGAVALSVGNQNGHLVLWASHNYDGDPVERRELRVFGTGEPFTTQLPFVGTVQQGDLVWHVFLQADHIE